jgi:hypothetical protein
VRCRAWRCGRPGAGAAGTPSPCHWVRPGPVRAPGRAQRRPGRRAGRGRLPPIRKAKPARSASWRDWAVQDRFERCRRGTRVVLRQLQCCRGDGYLAVFAALPAKSGECLLGATGLAGAHQGMQRCPCPGRSSAAYAMSPACPVCIRPAASRRLIKHACSRRELAGRARAKSYAGRPVVSWPARRWPRTGSWSPGCGRGAICRRW